MSARCGRCGRFEGRMVHVCRICIEGVEGDLVLTNDERWHPAYTQVGWLGGVRVLWRPKP